MDETVELLIMQRLDALREVLVDNGVNMAIDKDSGELFFFDSEKYKETGKATGFKVNMGFWDRVR